MVKYISWSPQADSDLNLILEYLNKQWDASVVLHF